MRLAAARRVALSSPLPHRAAVITGGEAVARFLREGKAASRIRHPHVVEVFDVGFTDEVPYLVMEYLEGRDLGALIKSEGALSPARTLTLMLPVLAAIRTAGSAQPEADEQAHETCKQAEAHHAEA